MPGSSHRQLPRLPLGGRSGKRGVETTTHLTKRLDKGGLIANAEIAGTVPMWEWIGDEGATTFSY